MEIIFTAETLGDLVLEVNHIEAYTQAMVSIYNTIKETLDLSLLNSIIVNEDYKEGLFEFQKKNGHNEFITDNEYGRGVAQVVSSELECGERVYNVIIDKHLVSMLVADEQLEIMKSNFNSQEEYDYFLKNRRLAINTLYHEFAHVYEYSLNRKIEWIQSKEMKTDLFSQLTVIAQQCWSEYFACRIASESFPFDETTAIEIIETCNTAERELQKERSKYNRRLVGLDEFVIEFHEYTNFILKKIASSHGNLYCLNDSREKIIDLMEESFGESYIKAIWVDFGKMLDELFGQYPNWESDYIFKEISELFLKYYEQFEIYISETPKGIYYDIPVRL